MKRIMFFCLLFVFAAGMNMPIYAQGDQDGLARLSGLRGKNQAQQMNNSMIINNQQIESAENTLSLQWPVEIVKNNLVGPWSRAGDFDNDNDQDLLIQNGDTLFWYENEQTSWVEHIIGSDFYNAEFAWVEAFDLDQDGDLDVFQYPMVNPSEIVWNENQMNGLQWEKHIIDNSVNQPFNWSSAYGDIDEDGDIDLAVSSGSDGSVMWFENVSGDTSWQKRMIGNIGINALWTSLADMDGDNDLDIISATYSPGNIAWYENQLPDTTWMAHPIAVLLGTALGYCFDLDEDGDQDIVTHSNVSNVLVWYENPSWTIHAITDGIPGLFVGPIGDIDQDGDPDVAFGGQSHMGWCENTGGAAGWVTNMIDTVENLFPSPIDMADINGDHYLDLTAYTVDALGNGIGDARWYANPYSEIRRVPQDYATIQAGIDAATDGNTVLVADSTYYENINFKGKAITVASQFIMDGDSNHIANTIIDGSQPSNPDSGSVVYFISGEDTNSVLCGFTITGGTGTPWTSPTQTLWKVGGGVYCDSSSLGATIINNHITQNEVSGQYASSGGLDFVGGPSFLILEGNHIFDNHVLATSGGGRAGGVAIVGDGMYARIVDNVFEQNTVIAQSFAVSGAVDLIGVNSLADGLIHGNVFRGNIVDATTANALGAAIGMGFTGPITISDNTFEDNKAKSRDAWAEGGAIIIDDEPPSSGYGRKMVVGNRFINNLSSSQFGNGTGGSLELFRTLATVSGNYFEQNTAQGGSSLGGAIRIFQSAFRLENNICSENTALYGGAVYVSGTPQSGTDLDIINNRIVKNRAAHGGGIGIASLSAGTNFEGEFLDTASGGALRGRLNLFHPRAHQVASETKITTQPQIINNTITGNTATLLGGGIYTSNAQTVVMNSILWGDSALAESEIYTVSGSIDIRYSDIQGGWPGEANIYSNPSFTDTIDYQLSDSSLCIGAGIDSVQIGGIWYYAPPTDLGGNPRPNPSGSMPDMGAWESPSGAPVGIHDRYSEELPTAYSLSQSYPNPFNPSTTIAYRVPRQSDVHIEIYSTLGQKLRTLLNERKEPGVYQAVWDGRNDSGTQVGSGVYLYRMVAGDYVQVRKMILMR